MSVWGLGRGGLPDTETFKQSPGNKGTGSEGQALESQGQYSSRGNKPQLVGRLNCKWKAWQEALWLNGEKGLWPQWWG